MLHKIIRITVLAALLAVVGITIGCGRDNELTTPASPRTGATWAPVARIIALDTDDQVSLSSGDEVLAMPFPEAGADPEQQCSLPTEEGYLVADLLGPLQESLASHGILTDQIIVDLAASERALRNGREARAREALTRVRAELARSGSDADADAPSYARSIVLRLDMLLALGDLRVDRIEPVAMAAEARAIMFPGAKTFGDCWAECMKGRITDAANELIQDLGGNVTDVVKNLINNCIDGAVAGLIAGAVTGAGALVTALEGCLLAINVDIIVQVADFMCEVAWGAAVCAWDCW